MEQGVIGAVIAALVTSVIVSVANARAQTTQHEHAYDIQRQQWNKEAAWRREDLQAEREQQRAAWDNARADREREREHDLLVQLQVELPRFSRAARVIYENKLAAEHLRPDDENEKDVFTPDPRDAPFLEEFNTMRIPMLATISRIQDDTLREAALIVHELDVAMAVGNVETWRHGDFWGGANPILQQVERLNQVVAMAGRLIRGELIDPDELMPVEHRRGAFQRDLEQQRQRNLERRRRRQHATND